MRTIEALKKRIESVEDLKSVVRTMKALSAVSIRQYEKAVEAINDYYSAVELGLKATLRKEDEKAAVKRAPGHVRRAVIVFGSDHGLCGQFNDRIFDHFQKETAPLSKAGERFHILAMGVRIVSRLEAAGLPADKAMFTPSAATGITSVAQETLMTIDQWGTQAHIDKIIIIHNSPSAGAGYQPVTTQLLPIDLGRIRPRGGKRWPSRSLPVYTVERKALLSTLIKEFLFVSIYQACAESLASEHAARLAAMQMAEKNIEDHLQEIQAQFRTLRQESITSELLDVVSGFEALRSQRSSPGARSGAGFSSY